MIISTRGIEGKKILEYKGIVFGEVFAGVNMFKDMAAGFRNIFGGRASSYEGELTQAREEVLSEMMARACECCANAIIGGKMDYETLCAENGMRWLPVAEQQSCSSSDLKKEKRTVEAVLFILI